MNANKKYKTAAAFRIALETRLKKTSQAEGTDLQRLRRSVAFDRLLCRLFSSGEEIWVLKGGYAMELRTHSARATKDIDLTIPNGVIHRGSDQVNEQLLEMLQDATEHDLGDYFTFLIGAPMLDLDAAPYGGARFPVTSSIEGKLFVKFHLDLGIGDVVDEPLEKFTGTDWLAFADVPAGEFKGLSREGQFAEKLHAFTRPRGAVHNSRVKDLVDMILLIDLGLDKARLKKSIRTTFRRRDSHPVPVSLEAPPEFWQKPYMKLAEECAITQDIDAGFHQISEFYSSLEPKTD